MGGGCVMMIYKGGIPMLKSFTLENVFSFADKHELNMQATKIKAHDYSLLTNKNNKNIPPGMDILPVMSIYGANASGKSNLIRSLLFVLQSIVPKHERYIMVPYLLNEPHNKNAQIKKPSFELIFLLDKNEYILTVCSMGVEFYQESLSWREAAKGKAKLLYQRKWNSDTRRWKLALGTTIVDKGLIEEIRYVHRMEKSNKNLLLYALCKRKAHNLFTAISRWVSSFSTSQYMAVENTMPGILAIYSIGEMNPHFKFLNELKSKERVSEFLRAMNPLIKGFDFIKDENLSGNSKDRYQLIFKYANLPEEASEIGEADELLSKFESRGIYSSFILLPAILIALEKGGLVIVDELESSLHPLLMAKVVSMFTNPDINTGGGQMIFTTHNALIMDRKYLRQDEISFVEKNNTGRSEIYRLSDIDGVRSDLDFCKNYILGAFGAVPSFN